MIWRNGSVFLSFHANAGAGVASVWRGWLAIVASPLWQTTQQQDCLTCQGTGPADFATVAHLCRDDLRHRWR